MKTKLALAGLACFILAACGGGGSGGGNNNASAPTPASNTPVAISDAQVLADISTSQASITATPVWDTSGAFGALGNPFKGSVDGVHSYRWNIERDGLIPVVDTTNNPDVTTALNNLETAVGKTLFTRLPASTNITNLNRGVVINNAVPPVQGASAENNCGEVYAIRQNLFSLWVDPTYSVDPPLASDWQSAVNGNTSVNPRPVFNVDINFNDGACAPLEPLVEHELLHALGLSNHFDGFGEGSGGNCNGAICTDRAYPVLKTLYSNPPMSVINSMTVTR